MRISTRALFDTLRNEPMDAAVRRTFLVGGAVSVICAGVAFTARWMGRAHKGHKDILWICLGGFVASIIAFAVCHAVRRPKASDTPPEDRSVLRSLFLALQMGMLLMILPAALRSWRSSLYDLDWLAWGFQDKRYIFALYWIGLLTVLVFPAVFYALLSPRIDLQRSTASPDRIDKRSIRYLNIFGKVALALGFAWYFAGPPWNLDQLKRFVDVHEQVHLGPLQAIQRGFVPYLGPASIQYGPGMQSFQYVYMEQTRAFSLVGLRETFAIAYLVSFALLCLYATLSFHPGLAVSVVLLARQYSSFSMYGWDMHGSLDGFYGWSNPLRYMGGALLVLVLPSLLKDEAKQPWTIIASLLMGLLWGLLVYAAPENISCGVFGCVILATLLVARRQVKWRALLRVSACLACGAAMIWIPILSYYAWHGSCLEFIRNFLLIPSLVSKGYTNTRYYGDWSDPLTIAFYFTPLLLAVAGLTLVFDLRKRGFRERWTQGQRTALAALCVVVACYPTVLFRSDTSHLTNVMTGLPILVVVYLREVPGLFGLSGFRRWGAVAAAGLVFSCMYPFRVQEFASPYQLLVERPTRRFMVHSPEPEHFGVEQMAEARLGGDLRNIDVLFYYGPSGQEACRHFNGLHRELGQARVFVCSFPFTWASSVYFLADLRPAPASLDVSTMVVNSEIRDADLAHMLEHLEDYDVLISVDTKNPYAQKFMALVPHCVVEPRTFSGETYYLLRKPVP